MPHPAIAHEARLLDLIEERAPRLRAAGLASVQIDRVSFTLQPPEIRFQLEEEETEGDGKPKKKAELPPPPADPLADPALYPGGVVPGFGAPTADD